MLPANEMPINPTTSQPVVTISQPPDHKPTTAPFNGEYDYVVKAENGAGSFQLYYDLQAGKYVFRGIQGSGMWKNFTALEAQSEVVSLIKSGAADVRSYTFVAGARNIGDNNLPDNVIDTLLSSIELYVSSYFPTPLSSTPSPQ